MPLAGIAAGSTRRGWGIEGVEAGYDVLGREGVVPRCAHRAQGSSQLHMADMSPTAKIAIGITAGYLLGRMKKFRLAVTVGGMLVGKKLATNPQALLSQGNKLIDNNPELRKLKGEITGRMLEAARDAALTTASSRLESMTQSLTALPGSGKGSDEDEEYEGDEFDDEYDDDADDAEDTEDAEDTQDTEGAEDIEDAGEDGVEDYAEDDGVEDDAGSDEEPEDDVDDSVDDESEQEEERPRRRRRRPRAEAAAYVADAASKQHRSHGEENRIPEREEGGQEVDLCVIWWGASYAQRRQEDCLDGEEDVVCGGQCREEGGERAVRRPSLQLDREEDRVAGQEDASATKKTAKKAPAKKATAKKAPAKKSTAKKAPTTARGAAKKTAKKTTQKRSGR